MSKPINMTSEGVFKLELIEMLNGRHSGWVDGDHDNNGYKSADLVNHKSKIAIEIKDDLLSEPHKETSKNFFEGSYDINRLNKQYFDDIKDANKKFRNYPGYKSILLIRTSLPMAAIAKGAIEGLHTFRIGRIDESIVPPPKGFIASQGLTYIGRRGKYHRTEIGGFIILNDEGFCYFPNDFADKNRYISMMELEEIGFKVKDIS